MSSILTGDCVEVMAAMAPNSVDAVVCDPPYELGFMGKSWDGTGVAYQVATWRAAYRVLKPGGHLLAFGGSRTYHRMACAVEDAGFEIRDQIMWLYGSGFPKSHNLKGEHEGWGTALKPAHEPIVVARKPLIGTVAANVLKHGTGALNVDGCRVGQRERERHVDEKRVSSFGGDAQDYKNPNTYPKATSPLPAGRWPANVILDEEAGAMLDEQEGHGASRFFYCPKASRKEREAGVGALRDSGRSGQRHNNHPTVKPVALMRYLIRLVTPPGGTVLDPFLGSGTTLMAAALEGVDAIGIEREAEYVEIAKARVAWAESQPVQMSI